MRPPGLSEGGRGRDMRLFAPVRACHGAGIVFLSGGQHARVATAHLNAISQLPTTKPGKVSFFYGRALQDRALAVWQGRDENFAAGQQAFYHRARLNRAASVGMYTSEMEAAPPSDEDPPTVRTGATIDSRGRRAASMQSAELNET